MVAITSRIGFVFKEKGNIAVSKFEHRRVGRTAWLNIDELVPRLAAISASKDREVLSVFIIDERVEQNVAFAFYRTAVIKYVGIASIALHIIGMPLREPIFTIVGRKVKPSLAVLPNGKKQLPFVS